MNKWEIEVQKSLLNSEAEAIKALEAQYKRALTDINRKVLDFQAEIELLDAAINQDGVDDATKALLLSQKRSKIYQKQYQEALQGQVSGILDKMQGDNYSTIESYLKDSYENGYVGTMYDIAKQGIPVIAPIDQAAAVRAILVDSKVSKGLYNRLGVEVSGLKKTITREISRGISTGMSYADIARNIANVSKAPISRTKTIARTEGHRIQQASTVDAQQAAKAKGADVLKQWNATLDGRTRPSHARVDGEIRELDEKFSNGLMYPGDPSGGAAEVVNCRCTSNSRARWGLDEEELNTLKERAEFFGLDKTENFEDFKKKYIAAGKEVEYNNSGIKLGELETAYGKKHSKAIKEHLEKAPEQIQQVWNDCAGDFHMLDPKYNGKEAFYSPGKDGVKLNITAAGKGSTYQTPYQVVFHEYGHHADYILNRKYGDKNRFIPGRTTSGNSVRALSETYKNGIFGKTLKEEGYNAVRVWAKDKGVAELPDLISKINDDIDKLIQAGVINQSERSMEFQRMRQALRFDIPEDVAKAFCTDVKQELTLIQRSDISDMFEPIMPKSCAYPFGVGHGTGYWGSRDNGKEGFAEMFSAAVNNPDSLEQIKRFFPESYKIFEEMLGVIKDD